MECYLAFTENKILLLVTWMSLNLSKTIQKEIDERCRILLVYELK